jgi:hypothetical protein
VPSAVGATMAAGPAVPARRTSQVPSTPPAIADIAEASQTTKDMLSLFSHRYKRWTPGDNKPRSALRHCVTYGLMLHRDDAQMATQADFETYVPDLRLAEELVADCDLAGAASAAPACDGELKFHYRS